MTDQSHPSGLPPVVYVQMVRPPSTNALAVASLVLGIVTAVLALIPLVGWVLLPVPGLLAFIFGVIGVNTGRKLEGKRVGLAIAGIILSLSPLILLVLFSAISALTPSQ